MLGGEVFSTLSRHQTSKTSEQGEKEIKNRKRERERERTDRYKDISIDLTLPSCRSETEQASMKAWAMTDRQASM